MKVMPALVPIDANAASDSAPPGMFSAKPTHFLKPLSCIIWRLMAICRMTV